MEIVASMCVYLRTGVLPWSGIDAPTKRERFEAMLTCKERTSAAVIGHAYGGVAAGAALEECVLARPCVCGEAARRSPHAPRSPPCTMCGPCATDVVRTL